MKNFLLLMVLPLIGCNTKDINLNDVHITPNMSFPFGKVSLSDSSLFSLFNLGDMLVVNSDDVVEFRVKDDVKIIKTSEIGKLFTTQEQTYPFELMIPSVGDPIEIEVPKEDMYSLFTFYFNTSVGERIDKLIFPNGKLEFKVFTSGNFNKLRGKILQITRNGLPIEFAVGDVITLDKDCVIAPISKDGKDNVVELKLSGKIPPLAQVDGEISIRSNSFSYLEGWVGRKSIDPVTTIFRLTDNGFADFAGKAKEIYFADPKFDITIDNQYDLPVMVTIDTLAFDNVIVDLKPEFNRSKFLIEPLKSTTIRLINSYTISGKGLSNAITKDLKESQISIGCVVNPTEADLGVAYSAVNVNKISADNELGAQYDAVIPFDFMIDGVTLSDAIDWDLGRLNEAKNMKFKEFAIAFSGFNELPFDMQLYPYVTDNNQNDGVKHYLFSEPIVISGSTSKLKPNAEGFLPFEFYKQNRVLRVVSQDKVQVMLESKKLFFEITTSTVDAINRNVVKLYSPSKVGLGINVGLKADINL